MAGIGALDASKLTVNITLAVAIGFAGVKAGQLKQDLVRDLHDLKGALVQTAHDSRAAHLDAEAAMRDGAEQRARIKALEDWKLAFSKRYVYDWSWIHGRAERLTWHDLREPLPEVN